MAGKEAVVNKAVEFQLVHTEVLGSHLCVEVNTGGTDRLMRLLRPFGFGSIVLGLGRQILVAKLCLDVRTCSINSFFGKVE